MQIIGTDLSHDNIDGASRGLYPPHALVELPPQWVLDWFDEGEPGACGSSGPHLAVVVVVDFEMCRM